MPAAKEPQLNRDIAKLHPAFRRKAEDLLTALQLAEVPFKMFEGYRSPARQSWLYASGRTRLGPIVTKADAGSSFHQYGLAGDFVLYVNGKWSWDSSRKSMTYWEKLHEIGKGLGLEPLSFEMPHLQVAGLKIADLRNGILPADPLPAPIT